MAWISVPSPSMTIFFSWIVMVNSTIAGPPEAFCVCLCTKGGATSSTLRRGSDATSTDAAALAGARCVCACADAAPAMGAMAPAIAAPASNVRRETWNCSVMGSLLCDRLHRPDPADPISTLIGESFFAPQQTSAAGCCGILSPCDYDHHAQRRAGEPPDC